MRAKINLFYFILLILYIFNNYVAKELYKNDVLIILLEDFDFDRHQNSLITRAYVFLSFTLFPASYFCQIKRCV